MLLNLYAARHEAAANNCQNKRRFSDIAMGASVTQKYPEIVFLRARSRVTNLISATSDTTGEHPVPFTAAPSPQWAPQPTRPGPVCTVIQPPPPTRKGSGHDDGPHPHSSIQTVIPARLLLTDPGWASLAPEPAPADSPTHPPTHPDVGVCFSPAQQQRHQSRNPRWLLFGGRTPGHSGQR